MRHPPLWIGLAYLLSAGTVARAGFEPNTYVYTSKAQEETSTHVLVGTIRAIHPLNPDPITSPVAGRRTLNLYVAEMDVAEVEKGQGLQPGDVAYLRFHSPKTSEEVEHPFQGFDCGLVNYRATPAPGNLARIYVNRNDEFQYVADYPQSFFRISKKELEASGSGLFRFVRGHPWPTSLAFAAVGVLLGFLAGRRRGRTKTGRPGPSDPAFMSPPWDEIPFGESWRDGTR